jgi:hypothetical protein
MNRIAVLLITMLLSIGMSSSQDQITQKEFETFCDSSGLEFTMPEGYTIAKVFENRDLWFSFAVINADSTMEIRYTIWSLKSALEEYEASLKDSNSMMVPPNNIYKGRIQANMLNMSGGEMYNIGPFPPQAVKREFNADAGGSCFLEFNCQFGEGYTYGQFVYLHKDDVADAIVTFMSNDKETHSELMDAGFHSLKFK